ncbi:MAG: helix-turn-helix transcriptional regulator [Kordiimonadaceae bacterium]|nr:helix-turn-helix transcriptional regulator [Kordiimonadaceae bacterium]
MDQIDSDFLIQANATILNQVDVLDSVSVFRWHIDSNQVQYERTNSHTLSMYISGGETTYRADKSALKGGPGKLCLMPQGHASHWHVNGAVEFVHLYFTDDAFKQYAARRFDRDVRTLDLQDLTYQRDVTLQALLVDYFAACENGGPNAPLFAEQTLYGIFDRLLTRYTSRQAANSAPITGGLSPMHRRLVKSAIMEGLHRSLSIEKLATLTALSPYHFARMFKLSFGAAPAQYIMRARIEKVKSCLKTPARLSEIAVATGFSQQSHMNLHFKRHVGVTPGVYRRNCQ